MDKRFARRIVALCAAVLVALSSAPAVFADGEIGDMGDTNSITDLYVSGSRVTAKVDNIKDCPAGLSCQIEVRFLYKCPEVWCLDWTSQGWRVLPSPVNGVSTIQANCNGGQDIDNYWAFEYRVKWWAPTTKTVEWWGELEYLLNLSGNAVYRLIAEAAFNVTGGAGWRQGTKIETTTATADYSPAVQVATSAGRVFHTC
jgi:hypothetical protein